MTFRFGHLVSKAWLILSEAVGLMILMFGLDWGMLLLFSSLAQNGCKRPLVTMPFHL
jgi:hypothetical protein